MVPQQGYAGFWVRFIADLIDSTLLTVASWLLELVLLGPIYWLGHSATSFQDAFNPLMLQVVNLGLYGALAFAYYTWGHYRFGTTFGKKVFRVYVVAEKTRMPLTLKQSILRTAGYIFSYLPLGAGFLMAAFHPEKRGLHDMIAGTVSISKEQQ